ncbi:MAG: hypothetical protein RJQ09_04980 [Cyclobacteriaceae bacterium]
MKKSILMISVVVLFQTSSFAQDAIGKGWGLGFQLGQYQRDFGIGLNVKTPYFVNDQIALRIKGNVMWNEHLDSNLEMTWSDYTNLSIGMIVLVGEIEDFIRLYGESGIILIQPSDNFSNENSNLGGYGLFGFEFYMYEKANYFIEIGGVGSGATADKIPTNPIYSNGLIINTGFRFQF